MTTDRVEGVYRRTHARLWRSLLAYTGDADLASDAEAEAFSQALARGEAIEDVEAWVWRSAFRIAAGLLKRSRELGSTAPVETIEVQAEPGAFEVPVVELLSLLDALSPQQRAVVVLRYVGQFRPREIAELLDTSSSTVRVQLHRAHRVLRANLERCDD